MAGGVFGLGYGVLALLRGVYAGSMAGLQIPAGRLAKLRLDEQVEVLSETVTVGLDVL